MIDLEYGWDDIEVGRSKEFGFQPCMMSTASSSTVLRCSQSDKAAAGECRPALSLVSICCRGPSKMILYCVINKFREINQLASCTVTKHSRVSRECGRMKIRLFTSRVSTSNEAAGETYLQANALWCI